jgi:PadR family transcriptional regulator PadR
MEQRGYLTSRVERNGSILRKLYRATPYGLEGLALARLRFADLTGEVK